MNEYRKKYEEKLENMLRRGTEKNKWTKYWKVNINGFFPNLRTLGVKITYCNEVFKGDKKKGNKQ